MSDLRTRFCKPCERGAAALEHAQVQMFLRQVPGWAPNDPATEIRRTFNFRNYHETIAFVNAVAWIAHREDHHPDLDVGYNRCLVRYSTHAASGLTENDFICAAKVSALIGE
jgi:4a-hydroxytetrahydrobiopterin dehydratase